MTEQLPPELAKLIAAERAAPAATHAIRAAVRAKLAATVAGAPLGAAVAGAGAGVLGAGKIIAIIAVVVGAGTVAIVRTQRPSSQTRAAAAPIVSRAESAAPTPPPPPAAAPAAPPPVAVADPPKPAPARTAALPPQPPAPAIPSEVEMLQEAWADLRRGEASQALELAVRDEELHANGSLSEERAALRIVALARLGRSSEAAESSADFSAKYPNSIHRSAIARALAGDTP